MERVLTDSGMQSPQVTTRDNGVTLIAIYHYTAALLYVLATAILAFPTLILAIVTVTEAPPAVFGMIAVGLVAAITMLLSLIHIIIGYGLWTLKHWARVAAMALAVVTLLAFPIGTAIGAVVLWYLMKSETAAQFETVQTPSSA